MIPVFRRATLPLLFLWLLCCITGFAQSSSYRFDHWTTDNGLPQNTITGMVQSRDGYLWLTTFDGLARFDGVRFTVFDKGNTRGINSNRFTCLYETSDGALLFGTEDAGFTAYHNGIFTPYTTTDGLPSNRVLSIFSDLNGEPVIRTLDGPVYLRGGKIVPAPSQYHHPGTRFYRSPSGTQVTMDANGIKQVKDGRVIEYPFKSLEKRILAGAALYEDSQGNLWLYEMRNVYKLRDGVITSYPQIEALRAVCEDADGGIWFGRPIGVKAEGDFLVRFKDGRFTSIGEADGILPSVIYSIVKDREGTIWLATSRGLYRARKRLLTAFSTENGLANHEVYPLMQSRNGDVWVGTALGLNRVRLAEGKFESFSHIQEDAIIQAFWEDAPERVWIGTVGRLRRYENGKIRELLKDITVFDVKPDREGNYWIATTRGVFKLNDDKVAAYYTTKEGLAGDDVKIIHQDRQGTLWFGTYGGLTRLKDGKFVSYTEADGLTGNHIRTVYEDAEGTLWIGTYDNGLSRFRDGKFFNYRTEQGLFNNGVFQILEDRRGYFWISCNKGIYRVSRRELDEMADGRLSRVNSVAFGKDDGMLNTECNGGRQPAGFVAQDGKLWFPTMGGVVVMDPEIAQVNPLPPPVKLESVRLEHAEKAFIGGVTVAPGQRDLEIAYTGLSFLKPEQVKFKYKLEGLDTDWVDAGTRRVAYFPYLSPGSYTFRVIAANSDGVWNTEGTALRIVVHAPFYRTIWFGALVVLSVAGIAYVAFRTRVAQLQRRQEEQAVFSRRLIESQESERKRIAAELHDGLGQSLLVIKNRALVGGMSPEDAQISKDQFDEISLTASQAIDEARRIAYDLRPYHLDRLGLAQSLEAMIERVAASTPIQFTINVPLLDGVFSKEEEASFYRIVQECVNNILKHSQATETLIAIVREEEFITLTVSDNGKGFVATPGEARHAGSSEKKAAEVSHSHQAHAGGFGLIGMAERVRMLHGIYTLETAPNQGTTITIKFPVL